MIEIRPTTQADIVAFSGHRSQKTIRAFTVLLDGEVTCIAGVTIEPDGVMAFSDLREGLQVPKMTIYRYAKQLADLIRGWGLPAAAVADPNRPNSDRFLERMGFCYIIDSEEGKVFGIWQEQPSHS